jgi:hypothetical protein
MKSHNITIENAGAPSIKLKEFIANVAAVIATCVLSGVFLSTFNTGYIKLSSAPGAEVPVLVGEKAKYQSFSGQLTPHEIPWIFDGEQRKQGKILAVWSANSERNASACKNEWEKKNAYLAMCGNLGDQTILAVQFDGISPPLVTYVPVSRIALVDVGQKVLVRMGRITGDGAVHSLPVYIRTLNDERGPSL